MWINLGHRVCVAVRSAAAPECQQSQATRLAADCGPLHQYPGQLGPSTAIDNQAQSEVQSAAWPTAVAAACGNEIGHEINHCPDQWSMLSSVIRDYCTFSEPYQPTFCSPAAPLPMAWCQHGNHRVTSLINTLRSRQMDAISQTTSSSAFSWMKIFEFRLKCHWSLFLSIQLTIFQHWFR